MSLGIRGQRRPRSACASAQYDQGLRCPLTDSLDTIECINVKQMPASEFAHAWDESKSVHFAHVRRHLFVCAAHIIYTMMGRFFRYIMSAARHLEVFSHFYRRHIELIFDILLA